MLPAETAHRVPGWPRKRRPQSTKALGRRAHDLCSQGGKRRPKRVTHMKVQLISSALCLCLIAACGGVAFQDGGNGSTGGAAGTGGTSGQGGSTNTGGGGSAGGAGTLGRGGDGTTGIGGAPGGGGSSGTGGAPGTGGSSGLGGAGGATGRGGAPGSGGRLDGGFGGFDSNDTCATGTVTFEFSVPGDGSGYCVNTSCNPSFVTVKTLDGQSIGSLSQGCQTSCDVCLPIACSGVCAPPQPFGPNARTQEWNGTYYRSVSCATGISCALSQCTLAGVSLIATMCAVPRTNPDSGICQGTDQPRCVDVPFQYPASGHLTVKGQLSP